MTGVFKGLPKLVGVVGSGQMGAGIAELVARNGIPVALTDASQAALDKGIARISKSIQKSVTKGLLASDEAQSALNRIQTSTDAHVLGGVDIVIEAIKEEERAKSEVFRMCDEVLPRHAILASNTSSISITRIASATSRPDQVIGLHFMNPPPVMKLIEIVRGERTSEDTFKQAEQFAMHMGKTVAVSNDRPGFIVNRILMPMINEAFFALHEGVATAKDIDIGMKLGTNQPMGPLTLADFVGLDVCLAIIEVMHEGLKDEKYRPCPLLVEYVKQGRLGRKVGQGVFTYKGR